MSTAKLNPIPASLPKRLQVAVAADRLRAACGLVPVPVDDLLAGSLQETDQSLPALLLDDVRSRVPGATVRTMLLAHEDESLPIVVVIQKSGDVSLRALFYPLTA